MIRQTERRRPRQCSRRPGRTDYTHSPKVTRPVPAVRRRYIMHLAPSALVGLTVSDFFAASMRAQSLLAIGILIGMQSSFATAQQPEPKKQSSSDAIGRY